MSNIKTYKSIENDDAEVAKKQVQTGLLSGFVGAWGKEFLGGENVRNLENKCKKIFDFKYAISVNSWTSGLQLMIGSLQEDKYMKSEVIVTPWTMSATVMAIIHNGLIPRFVDIDLNTFMPRTKDILNTVNSNTKAILMADIFGQSFPYEDLVHLKDQGIKIFSDAAQAPLVKRNKKPVGFLADATGVSFNRHKHINTGEGGIILTNDQDIYNWCILSRNHGENIDTSHYKFTNMVGFNYRLTETQAAIGLNQLNKLGNNVQKRQLQGNYLNSCFAKSKYFDPVLPIDGNEHAYYIYPLKLKKEFGNTKFRKKICNYVKKNNFPPLLEGYQNIHKLDVFTKKSATSGRYSCLYNPIILPNAEKLHNEIFIGILLCNHEYSKKDLKHLSDLMEEACGK